MSSPMDRRYSETHEWHKLEGGRVTIGVTKFAVDELTDITYVDISKPTGAISTGEPFGEIESVKATSELYSGIDGVVIEVNQEVLNNPGLVNEDPFERGWLIKIEPSNPEQIEMLLDPIAYDQSCGAG